MEESDLYLDNVLADFSDQEGIDKQLKKSGWYQRTPSFLSRSFPFNEDEDIVVHTILKKGVITSDIYVRTPGTEDYSLAVSVLTTSKLDMTRNGSCGRYQIQYRFPDDVEFIEGNITFVGLNLGESPESIINNPSVLNSKALKIYKQHNNAVRTRCEELAH